MPTLGLNGYICDVCELAWTSPAFTHGTSTTLAAVVKAHGIEVDDLAVLR